MNEASHANTAFGPYDLIPSGVIIVDKDFSVFFWNSCMEEWTGIPPEQIEGTNLLDRYPTLRNPSIMARIDQLFHGGPAVLFSPTFHPHLIPCTLPNGSLMVHKISFIPLVRDDKAYALVLIEDVSDLTTQVKAYRDMKKIVEKQLNELKIAQDAIFTANKKLNLLNSITRHDIMNKLTILIGYLELTREKDLADPELVKYLHTELQAAEAIKDQIQFTKFYQDIGVNNAIWQDVRQAIESAIRPLNCLGIQVVIDLADVEIFADPLLQKVFYNLVENSIRHGEKLTRIRFSSVGYPGGLSIIYEDDGVGVAGEVKEKIFRREHFKNTGFGLFLSREILGITSITIGENGVPGHGARFEIRVPDGAWRYKGQENSIHETGKRYDRKVAP
ncbi:MAG TPA: ATP-binding protein [Methanoregulaceae archaeon]|nr:ATP-binding protein [Methanoregulaceae archaeon]